MTYSKVQPGEGNEGEETDRTGSGWKRPGEPKGPEVVVRDRTRALALQRRGIPRVVSLVVDVEEEWM